MYSVAVLTKVIKARPNLVSFGAIRCSALKAAISAILGRDSMNALHVSIFIVVCTESF